MTDPKNSHPIPDPEFSGKNLRDEPALLPSWGYSVYEWTPQDNGEGKPEQVHLMVHLAGSLDGAAIVMCIKSRLEINRLITILERHRDGVWPT